jgi:GH24 family phage-related lysozyme (muramidase)
MRPVPAVAAHFVAEKEACRLTAYRDSAGVPTIGYGHTGPDVRPGMRCLQKQAEAWLKADLETAAKRLALRVKADVIEALTSNQYAALLAFVFNIGAEPGWKIWKVLNARQFDQVPVQMMRFVYAGKPPKKLNGLVNRRTAEVALWADGEPGTVNTVPPSSETRAAETPPAPEPVKPLVQSRTVAVQAGQIIGGISAGAVAAQQVVEPQADKAAVLQNVVAFLAVVVVVCGALTLAIKWLEKREAKA